MCGIIGYVGERNATPILVEGLRKLEYRGYDSSGVGVIPCSSQEIVIRKTPGKIKDLDALLRNHPMPPAFIGISHTRWATHGAPTRANAHPHFDCSKRFLVVHNGIIENYESLKEFLIKKGHVFVSQTDTEIIAHLIEEYYQGDLVAAVRLAIKDMLGAFAIGVICRDFPHMLIAARMGSPLIVGLGKHENYIASDVPAILDRTRRIMYLKDGEMAVLTKDHVGVSTFSGRPVRPRVDTVSFNVEAVQKQGFSHFMLKEIHEQPEVLTRMFQSRFKGGEIVLPDLKLTLRDLKKFRQIMIVACGTAYHAGLVGKYFIEHVTRMPVIVDLSSEFRYRNPIVPKDTLVIAISQSGETADTLAAVKEAKAKGAVVIAVCNAVGSSLTRESDGVLYTHAGPEIGVASTKAYTAQIAILYLLGLKLSMIKKSLSAFEFRILAPAFRGIPKLYERILKDKNVIVTIAKNNSHFGSFLFLGRNINFPSALEGALKLKEISYIPAEGYAAGEMKHGPIALIDEYRAVVCIVPLTEHYEKMISNMQEIRARKGKIIAIATQGDKTIKRHASHVIYVPPTHHLLTPLVVALPLQLLSYYIATQKGCDVDQPRNLAKSVTVE